MVVKVYISGISGNKEVKKRQQRVLMILESKSIKYEAVDITEPGKEGEKDYMQSNSTSSGATVSDTNPRHPLPPQLFNDTEYCGDYEQFDLANEIDTLEQFLKVEPPSEPDVVEKSPEKEVEAAKSVLDVEKIIEQVERNGITSSRETSAEAETKLNGDAQSEEADEGIETKDEDIETQEEDIEIKGENNVLDAANAKKDTSPSEDLIASESTAE